MNNFEEKDISCIIIGKGGKEICEGVFSFRLRIF